MNAWLVRAALRLHGLPPSARVVLLAHADACSSSGRTCLPGLEELATTCELSPKHVLRLRAQLVAAGHLRKLAAAHPGQRPVYEVLPAVPIPIPGSDRTRERQRVAASGRADADNGSHGCDPPYKTQGITPPTPRTVPSPIESTGAGGRRIFERSSPLGRHDSSQTPTPEARGPEAGALAEAAIAALGPGRHARIDELGRRRLERAAAPLVAGWTPSDLARRIGAERLDRAENLAAVLCAVLRRYALEPAPRELRTAERAARQARAAQPPPEPCAHGDPGGCAACSFCRRGLADPEGERCRRCEPAVPVPRGVSA